MTNGSAAIDPSLALAELLDFGLCCPVCKGTLRNNITDGVGSLFCAPCSRAFPVLHGIPDLRVASDPYIGIEADRAKGTRLAEHQAATWQDLAAHYYDITLDTVPPAQARQFAAGLHAAEPRADAALVEWTRLCTAPIASTDALLDVGCGTAPLLVAAHRQQPRTGVTVGVDVAFRWLVVAKRRLADAGVRAHLVCACAEALPFREGVFDVCTSQATIENVRNQNDALDEMHRVLVPNGRAWFATANRLSLGPDPHLGIPAGGYLSDARAADIARRRGALPPVRRLLSRSDLAALLASHDFTDVRFGLTAVPPPQRAQAGALIGVAADLYGFARATPLLRGALLRLGPTVLATARCASRAVTATPTGAHAS